MNRKSVAAAVALFVFALSAQLSHAAENYKIDPAHSSVNFSVKHLMVSTVSGRFSDVSGTIAYDEKDPSKSSVQVTVKTASINTDNADRDKHLKTGDFFEVEKYPEATFKSKRVEKRGDQWVAIGDLTIKDVTKEVVLPFTVEGKIVDGKGKTHIGFSSSLNINRQDYNVKWQRPLQAAGGVTVSDEVKLKFDVEAVSEAPAAAPAAAPSK